LLDGEAEITSITDGSRAGFKVVHKYFSSEIAQNIWLYSENARIDFETEIDWHEQHQLIKVAFPVDVHTNSAIYETQFGHIERASHSNTSWDEAKFEVCGHKWAVVAENNYGLALLNDCKYGHNAEGSTLKLTLLKCGTYPDEVADQGKHLITYSIMPFSGDFREAGVIAEAYALNQPLSAVEIKANNGKLADSFSLVSCDKENIIVETAKKAEDDNSLIVRMYDSFDRRTTATITVAEGFKKAYLCNMMETEIEELEFTDNKVTLPVSNFEIVTLKFTE
jgi:alpha-mannosidase